MRSKRQLISTSSCSSSEDGGGSGAEDHQDQRPGPELQGETKFLWPDPGLLPGGAQLHLLKLHLLTCTSLAGPHQLALGHLSSGCRWRSTTRTLKEVYWSLLWLITALLPLHSQSEPSTPPFIKTEHLVQLKEEKEDKEEKETRTHCLNRVSVCVCSDKSLLWSCALILLSSRGTTHTSPSLTPSFSLHHSLSHYFTPSLPHSLIPSVTHFAGPGSGSHFLTPSLSRLAGPELGSHSLTLPPRRAWISVSLVHLAGPR